MRSKKTKEIITDLKKLHTPVDPIKFLADDATIDKKAGEKVIKAIREYLESNTTVLAVAAPQLGIKKRAFGIRFDDQIKVFINPIITKKVGMAILPETFTSMPGKEILIGRPTEITVLYVTEEFKQEENKMLDAAARLFDQQCQLLDGITPDGYGLVSDVEEDGSLSDATEEEMQELREIYAKYLTTKLKQYENTIQSDPELTKQYRYLKFTENVINGRTLVVNDEDQKRLEKENKTREALSVAGAFKQGKYGNRKRRRAS